VAETTMLDAALALASDGYAVFPLQPGTKNQPLVKAWQQVATRAPEQVTTWWTRWPAANIGICCGLCSPALVVIDLDCHGDVDGLDTWGALCVALDFDDDTLRVRTPSGGEHLYWTAPDGHELSNTAGKLGEGIDTRAGAGYVVAPPSRTRDGAYEPLGGTRRDLPMPLVSILSKAPPSEPGENQSRPSGRTFSTYVQRAIEAEADRVTRAAEGTRNATLNAAAFARPRWPVGWAMRRSNELLPVGWTRVWLSHGPRLPPPCPTRSRHKRTLGLCQTARPCQCFSNARTWGMVSAWQRGTDGTSITATILGIG